MKRVLFILAFVLLLTVPVLAADEEPALELDELPQAVEAEFDVLQEPEEAAGEVQIEDLFWELYRVREILTLIFWGVVYLCGVIVGCFAGITLIRMWGV